MPNYICTTCGTQYASTASKPERCAICEDERQYINPAGQQWITLEQLRNKHKLVVHKKEKQLYGIGMTPRFGIGQRCLLITTPQKNILWDCIPLINQTAVDFIDALGGLDAIAISHPHYYSTMVEWSHAFGDVPIYLHERDQSWIQRNDPAIQCWNGNSIELSDDVTLYNPGGHFDGGAILHWQAADRKGVLLTGDILQVTADRKHVSFMYSFPNNIPLNAHSVRHIADIVTSLQYDRIYGAWWDKNILTDAREAVNRSVNRYISAIE